MFPRRRLDRRANATVPSETATTVGPPLHRSAWQVQPSAVSAVSAAAGLVTGSAQPFLTKPLLSTAEPEEEEPKL